MRCLGLVVVVGCSSAPSPASDGPVDPDDALDVGMSGTRLEARQWNFDGTRLLAPNFHDVLRDEICEPRTWSDGSLYCTPLTPFALVVYSDPACTQAVAAGNGGGYAYAQAGLYAELGGSESLIVSALYAIGGAAPSLSAVYLADGNGGCGEEPGGLGPLSLITSVPSSDLAAMRLGEPVGSGRVQLESYESDDGLHVFHGGYDREIEQPCTFVDTGDPVHGVCVPSAPSATDEATTTVEEVASSRQINNVDYVADGLRAHADRLHDDQLASDCEPMVFADGIARCVPGHITSTAAGEGFGISEAFTGFTDAACTMPITAVAGGCGPTLALAVGVSYGPGGQRSAPIDVFPASGSRIMAAYAFDIMGTCKGRFFADPESDECAAIAGPSMLDQLGSGVLETLPQ